MIAKRFLVVVLILAGVGLLAACEGGMIPGGSLAGAQQNMLSTAWSAGQTAEGLGDYIRATESAKIYQTAAAQQTQMARAQATAQAQEERAYEATLTAGQTQAALDVRQRELDLRAQEDAVAQQRALYEEQLKREQLKTRLNGFGETVKGVAQIILMYVLPILILLVTLVLGGYASWKLTKKRSRQAQVLERGQHGLAPVFIDEAGRVHVPDRQFWNVYDPEHPELPPMEAQAALDEGMVRVQGVVGLSAAGRPPSTRSLAATFNPQPQLPAAQDGAEEILTADWRWMDEHWRPGNGFILGMGPGQTVVQMDPERDPHLLIAGTSGSGKSLEGALPLAATALASGYLVVVANGAAGDYEPLAGHRNLVTARGSVESVAAVLEAVAKEVDRRDGVLARAGITTWSRLPAGNADGPNLVVIVDELVALAWEARTINTRLAQRIWTAAIHITSKGRKMGISLVAVTTDPTYRTLGREGLTVRDNCARLVFRLRDRAVSQAALDADGAESLPEHHFLSSVRGTVTHGISFAPSMSELARWLERRPVTAFERPEWLSLDPGAQVSSSGANDEEIVRLWRQGRSMNEIQRAVFGYTGGAAYNSVQSVMERWLHSTSTTTESGAETGSTGEVDSSSTDDLPTQPIRVG